MSSSTCPTVSRTLFVGVVLTVVTILVVFKDDLVRQPVNVSDIYRVADADSVRNKKKILIFSSKGGGGHTSVAHALLEYMNKDYAMAVVNIFTDVLGPIMPPRWFGDRFEGETIYNYAFQQNWHLFVSFLVRAGKAYFGVRHHSAVAHVSRYLAEHKPDLIISVVPIINGIIADAAKEHQLPVLLLPTDLDATTFVRGVRTANYDKFHIGMSFDDKAIRDTIKPSGVPAGRVHVVGFPVRSSFLQSERQRVTRRASVRRSLCISKKTPTILVLMGSLGSTAMVALAKRLAQLTHPTHVIFAIGRSEHLRKNLAHIKMPSHVTTTVLGFTDKVADYMAASDVIITKSGTVSVCEAIYVQLPIFLDSTTSDVLVWERFNHRFVFENGVGATIPSSQKVAKIMDNVLSDHEMMRQVKNNFTQMKVCDPRKKIRALVGRLIAAT